MAQLVSRSSKDGRHTPRWRLGVTRGPDIFPSKDIAEQHALDFIAMCKPHARSWFDYLGAFPEGETPD